MLRPPSLVSFLALGIATAVAAQPQVTSAGENMRLQSASVAPSGATWSVTLTMADDNGNGSLPTSYRRWWHCQIGNLSAAGETLQVRVTNAGYSDVILPVWSLSTDGVTFGSWTRVPTSATPQVTGSTHRFTLATPPGTIALRLAKWFPYTVTDKNAFLATLAGHSSGRVRSITTLGTTVQGRPIEMVELTDPNVPDAGKTRIWIHAGIHPAENTSYFTVEGLISLLLANDPFAGTLMRNAIVNIVPMTNPDGVFLGNYRTNSRSVNLESQWGAPYNNNEREITALRTRIESYMGTSSSPGSNPIEVMLNLHSTHNVSFPFHFRHQSNPSWNSTTNNSGVLPSVNALETSWIQAFMQRSGLANRGTTQSSSCGAPSRPFVECMMHDRWSANPAWSGSPNNLPQVMAITFEGTYGAGPVGVAWNTPEDYRTAGQDMGRALVDYLSLPIGTSITAYGPTCGGLSFSGTVTPGAGTNQANLTMAGALPFGRGWLLVGGSRAVIPLPPPWTCSLLTPIAVSLPFAFNNRGVATLSLSIPWSSGLIADLQGVSIDFQTGAVSTSNGLELENQFLSAVSGRCVSGKLERSSKERWGASFRSC